MGPHSCHPVTGQPLSPPFSSPHFVRGHAAALTSAGPKGGGQQTCLMVVPTVSYVFLLTRAVQGLLWGCSGPQNRREQFFLRIYGFEGELGGRRGCGHGSANQNVAGSISVSMHAPQVQWSTYGKIEPSLDPCRPRLPARVDLWNAGTRQHQATR